MGCYIVPTTAALIHYFLRKKNPSWNSNKYHSTLNMLLLGGAAFGVIDHWWNGELFLIGNNIVADLILGVVITISIFGIALLYVLADKIKTETKFLNF